MSVSGHGTSKESNARGENSSSMGSGSGFEEAWADLRPRLHRLLISRGIATDVADDIVQDAAIKLLSNWRRIDLEQPLWPLARTITLNCLADNYRRVQPVPVSEVPDAAAVYDVEEHGLARARLSMVGRAMATLRMTDRATLIEAMDGEGPGRNTSAAKMARMRARQRLMSALERTASVFSAVPLTYRRVQIWMQSHPFAEIQGTAASVGATAVAVTLVLTPVDPSSGPRDGSREGGQRHRVKVASAPSQKAEPTKGDRKRAPSREDRTSVNTVAEEVPTDTSSAETETTGTPARRTTQEEPQPDAPDQETKVGPARAGTDEGKGYQQVHVCTGEDTSEEEDDQDISVTYNDGDQDYSEDEPEGCE
jgi:DNA-directed RNA polymerase specialized sigma24 family protein